MISIRQRVFHSGRLARARLAYALRIQAFTFAPVNRTGFRAVAEAMGQSNMSAAWRLVMWERYRALGLAQPAMPRGEGAKR